jgi:hypothetical protein
MKPKLNRNHRNYTDKNFSLFQEKIKSTRSKKYQNPILKNRNTATGYTAKTLWRLCSDVSSHWGWEVLGQGK